RLPITANDTRQGRATNRRVMFVVVERRPCPTGQPGERARRVAPNAVKSAPAPTVRP
ncbi:MAG: hypothetical protein ACI9U2_001378, partial [Bradymonadia bacterium]